jgi:translocator protein
MVNQHPVVRLFASLALCLLAGYADLYLFLPTLTGWYGSLQKPSFIPSVTIIYYGIIVLSLLMACSLYIIWNAAQTSKDARLAVWLVIFALILNVGWFFAFFWVKSVFFSMVVMAILLTVLAAVIYQSLRSAVLAVLFTIPYFIVMLIATYANVLIYLTNPNLPLLGFAL